MKAPKLLSLKATEQDRRRLEAEVDRLSVQLQELGAIKVILIGSLARGQISLFSDIDLIAIFDDPRTPRALTRWVYKNLDTGEAVDVLAYNPSAFEAARQRPFLRHALQEGKVIYERTAR